MNTAKAAVRAKAIHASVAEPVLVMPTTPASSIQAMTSSTAAAQRAAVPSGALYSPLSTRILASTGKAVMHMAAPMKSENASAPGGSVTPSTNTPPLLSGRSGVAMSTPSANGTTTPLNETDSARRPSFRISRGSSSRPTRNMKNTSPRSASCRSGTSAGNSAPGSPGNSRPRTVGPSRIPATISPITAGCPIFLASAPKDRAATMMMARSSSRNRRTSVAPFTRPSDAVLHARLAGRYDATVARVVRTNEQSSQNDRGVRNLHGPHGPDARDCAQRPAGTSGSASNHGSLAAHPGDVHDHRGVLLLPHRGQRSD